jgi:uncharacterized protein YbjT (DUF2867 family)
MIERESNQIRLPFGEGKTSPVAAADVARVVAALLGGDIHRVGKSGLSVCGCLHSTNSI